MGCISLWGQAFLVTLSGETAKGLLAQAETLRYAQRDKFAPGVKCTHISALIRLSPIPVVQSLLND